MNRTIALIFRCGGALALAACIALASDADAQSAGEPDPSWPRITLGLELANPDLGYLNHKPAGRYGRVRASGEDLVFGDGTKARFWGVNVQARALFRTSPDNIRAHARRIASLGFNLVRFHHHDSNWSRPNVFGDKAKSTRRLDPNAMDRLDLWIAALKAEGVYVWLDLHTGRQFTEQDGIWRFDEIAGASRRGDVRGFNYVSDSIQQAMLDFQQAYLSHLNPHTGLRYSEDPAILAVLVTNENDLTHHFGNRLLPNKNVPAHNALYMELASDFARQHGLDRDATWRAWEYGPSKIFLNDLERRFNEKMIAGIREAGFDGLVATTNSWGANPIAALPSLTNGSIIDVHAYGVPGELTRDPRRKPGFPDRAAASQVAGMPLSISEWNITHFPAEDRLVAPLRMAASAAYQGWDAPMVYGYGQSGLNQPLKPGNWAIAHDPAMISMMPAAALLYREGHVEQAGRTYALRLPSEAFFGQKVTADLSPAIRTLSEQGRLVVELPRTQELPWLTPVPAPSDAETVTDVDRSYLAEGADAITSDTGEIQRDFARGLLTIDTDRTQLAAGTLAGAPIVLSDVSLNSPLLMGAIAVQSLDGQPIKLSRRILLSLSARAMPVGQKDTAYGIEPMFGELRVSASPDLVLTYPGGSALTDPAAHALRDGTHIIDLSRLGGANWMLLQ